MGSGGSTLKAERTYILAVEDGYGPSSQVNKKKEKPANKRNGSPPESKSPPVNTPAQSPQTTQGRKSISGTISLGSAGRSNSIAAMSRQGGFSGGAGGGGVGAFKTSKKFAWLIKGGNFANLPLSSLECGRIIGTGLMGTVRPAKLPGKEQYIALKSVRKDYIHKHNDERHMTNERVLMSALNSPFCIKLLRTYQDAQCIYFAMELAVGGELFHRLSKKASFPNQVAKFYVCEIFSAIKHVQSLGYVYRDLKPENVMLDEDGHCKLVDFGFSTQPQDNGQIKTMCGTPAYLSPEQLDGKFTNGYTRIVDWWSLGILIFELMTGLTPFCKSNSETRYEIYLRILKNNIRFPSGFDATSKSLVQRLCHSDLSKRLTNPDLIAEDDYFPVPWEAVDARKLVPPFVPRIKEPADHDHYFDQYHEPVKMSDSASALANNMTVEGF